MSNQILVVNSGSSSLKFGLFTERSGDEAADFSGGADGIGQQNGKLRIFDSNGKPLLDESYTLSSQPKALGQILQSLSKFSSSAPCAVGHRVVHGGPHLRTHQRITDELIETLETAVHFAPLHIPAALELIRETEHLLPGVQQFACFDTAFHRTLPETSCRFALPEALYEKGVQRYGFHGLSYESVLHRLGEDVPSRVVCAHLGSGASLAALREGRSVDTTMGLTPTGGIPMATRPGDLDPGVLLFLLRSEKLDADALEQMLNHQSGLAAFTGGVTDMRELQDRMQQGDAKAALAIHVFAAAVRKAIGAYAALLGGLDLLIFTGGIGEHSAFVRDLICQDLAFLGIERNVDGSYAKVKVMPSEEEVQIARHCRQLMQNDGDVHPPS
jgi:acetate kinase